MAFDKRGKKRDKVEDGAAGLGGLVLTTGAGRVPEFTAGVGVL
jgi:hypothetical protein